MKKTPLMALAASLLLNSHIGLAVYVPLPNDVSPQNDEWSCGVYAAAVMMRFQGESKVTYESLKESCPKSVSFQGFSIPNTIEVPGFTVGPNPFALAKHMNSSRETLIYYKAQWNKKLTDILARLDKRRPIIALLNIGEEERADFSQMNPFFRAMLPTLVNSLPFVKTSGLEVKSTDIPTKLMTPKLHYVVVNGYETVVVGGKERLEIYYRDSDGKDYTDTQENFLKRWNWKNKNDFIGKVLDKEGITGGMMLISHKETPVVQATPVKGPAKKSYRY